MELMTTEERTREGMYVDMYQVGTDEYIDEDCADKGVGHPGLRLASQERPSYVCMSVGR